MKDLYDITEGILDIEDTMDKADSAAELAASAEWLKKHGVKYSLDYIVSHPDNRPDIYDPDTKIWHFDDADITLTKADKEIPAFIKIDILRRLKLIEYPGETIPQFGMAKCQDLIIRDCPRIKSLVGSPMQVDILAVSGCPKITSLDGCPIIVKDMFKFISNGIKVTWKDMVRKCKGLKKDQCIYDKSI